MEERRKKRVTLEREIKSFKEVPQKQKKLDENKKDDKEAWKLFRQLLREKVKNIRLEESVEKKELERKVEQLESKLIKITNEKENKEKELNNKLFQLETAIKNLKLVNYQLEKEIFFLRKEKRDSEKELSYRELINRRDKQRLEKETDKLK